MSKAISLLIFVFLLYSFKAEDNIAQYTLSKEKNEIVLTASFDSKIIHDALVKSNKCDDNTKVTVCLDSYLIENIEIMADSAVAKFSFMSSSMVNSKLTMKYRLSRIPADFRHLIIKNTVMNNEDPKFINVISVQLGKKAKEIKMTSKESVAEFDI